LPQGVYRVLSGAAEETRTFLPGDAYRLDLRAGKALDLQLSQETAASGEVILRASVRGNGQHSFALRAENLGVEGGAKLLTLKPGASQTFAWHGKILAADTPWVAVVIPDGDLSRRKELMGSTGSVGKNHPSRP
jgi:hypothetical protein